MKTEIKLNQFFENELQSDLKDVLITRDHTGKYSLYGKYTVVPINNGLYRASGNGNRIEFSTVKNAVAWCTLHNAKRHREAGKIEQLDLKLCSIDTDLLVHRHMIHKHQGRESKWIYINKLQEDLIKKQSILNEIKFHINSCKTILINKFNVTK
jgi:hypothetical protein